MFARLSAAILLALPLLVSASCSTADQQCCQKVQSANSPEAARALSLVNVVADATAQIGLTCVPITAIGASGINCNAQAVCCENNSFNGAVAIGCTPLNINA